MDRIKEFYQGAKEEYAKIGVDTDEALRRLAEVKISMHCWQGDDFIDDNTLAVNIARLRKKLDAVGYKELIQTKKGIGYYLMR